MGRAPRVATSRLVLRPFEVSDVDWVHGFASDPDVCRFTDWGPNDRAGTERFLADAVLPDRPSYLWAVTLADGTGLGSAGLEVTAADHRRGSFGFVLAREHWGRGYATEVAHAIVGHAFGTLGLHRLEATCHPDNHASARVLEKAGLRLEGRLRDHLFVRGAWRDSLLWARLRSD